MVKVGARRFGVIVDRILNNEEIVVKPMHPALKSLSCYSGATILGDGRVALILDIAGIARHAGVFAALGPPQAAAANGQTEQNRQPVLLFQYGEREQFAVALAMIRRIELIRKERIEQVGDKEYVTLDGVPTRVLRLDRCLHVSPCVDRDPLFLLLPRNLPRSLGILASNLIDTEQLVIELNTDSHTEDGLHGTAIVRGRMTLFLDIFRLADKLEPARPEDRRPHALPPVKRRVLLVDDTQFFREVVKGYLEAEGYEVETAVDGADGLKRLDAGQFDLVVSDIEMPVLDGWGFARAVRQLGAEVPLLALTTLSTDTDRARALACGFDRYEVKLDRERFLAAVAELLPETTPAREGERMIPNGQTNDAKAGLYCTFRLAGRLFGVNVLDVKEVSAVTTRTPIPHAPANVWGYVNLRGQIHLLLDLRRMLGLERGEPTPDCRLVLFKPSISESFGVLVDSIGDIVRLGGDKIEPRSPAEEPGGGEFLLGVGELDDDLVILLEPRRFLPALKRLNPPERGA